MQISTVHRELRQETRSQNGSHFGTGSEDRCLRALKHEDIDRKAEHYVPVTPKPGPTFARASTI